MAGRALRRLYRTTCKTIAAIGGTCGGRGAGDVYGCPRERFQPAVGGLACPLEGAQTFYQPRWLTGMLCPVQRRRETSFHQLPWSVSKSPGGSIHRLHNLTDHTQASQPCSPRQALHRLTSRWDTWEVRQCRRMRQSVRRFAVSFNHQPLATAWDIHRPCHRFDSGCFPCTTVVQWDTSHETIYEWVCSMAHVTCLTSY